MSIPKKDWNKREIFKRICTIFMKDLRRIIDKEGKGYDISQ